MFHQRFYYAFIFLAFSLSLLSPVSAADKQSVAKQGGFTEAQAIFEKGLAGDEDSNEKAHKLFRQLVKQHPDNPLYLAYLGSTETIFARDGWLPWSRIKNMDKGLDHVDKALAMLTAEHDKQFERGSVISIETRLVALTTYLKVPDFANRLQDAKDLFAETIKQSVFPKAPAEVRQRIFLQGADIAKKEKRNTDELRYLKKALSIRAQGREADQIRQRLKAFSKESVRD